MIEFADDPRLRTLADAAHWLGWSPRATAQPNSILHTREQAARFHLHSRECILERSNSETRKGNLQRQEPVTHLGTWRVGMCVDGL